MSSTDFTHAVDLSDVSASDLEAIAGLIEAMRPGSLRDFLVEVDDFLRSDRGELLLVIEPAPVEAANRD